jgi:DNA-3-methyladenine glycosylase II
MTQTTFELTPVPPFRLDLTVWALRRRAHNILDRWDGATWRRVLSFPTGPVEVAVTQQAPSDAARLQVAIVGQPMGAAVRTVVTSELERLLGLSIDLTEFYRFAAHHRRLGPLAHRFCGMKPPRFATVFESAINAIACQQLTLTLGIHLLNRLTVAYGPALGEPDEAVYAFPRPMDLAGLLPRELREFGFSQQKGRAMIELAQSVAEGRLDLESFHTLPDDEAVRRISALRGLGRWSAEYVLLRGLGRTHILPGDDVGARKNLQRWLRLEEPLDYEQVRRVLAGWNCCAGLVYFHLLLDRLEEAGYLSERNSKCRDASGSRQQRHSETCAH